MPSIHKRFFTLKGALSLALAGALTVAGTPAVAGAQTALEPGEPGQGDPASVQAADTAAAAGEAGYMPPGSAADYMPSPERHPERYLPSPPADPWYAHPPQIDPATPAGTVLASRPVQVPFYNLYGIAEAHQVLVRSNDSYGNPHAIIATILYPTAQWTGPGSRPLVASNHPIDSLGLDCSPSYTLSHKFSPQLNPFDPSFDQRALNAGMALVLPDHQGPKAAYAAGRLAGQAVLDSMRAARSFVPPGHTTSPLADSLIGQIGFSGGAIAGGWAAQIQPTYAPDLDGVLVGTSIGGVPADFGVLMTSMDGNYGSAGLFRAAVLGVAREYPQLYRLLNPAGDMFAYASRDMCGEELMAQGAVALPIADLTLEREAFSDPEVRHVLAENRMGVHRDRPEEIPQHPMQIWQGDESVPLPGTSVGLNDYWVPTWAVQRLAQEWQDAGVDVTYTPVAGEHLMSGYFGIIPSLQWLDAQFRAPHNQGVGE